MIELLYLWAEDHGIPPATMVAAVVIVLVVIAIVSWWNR